MAWKSCKSQEEKLQLMPAANLTFMTGTTNYCPSMLNDDDDELLLWYG